MRRICNLLLCCMILLLAACEKDTLPNQFAPSVHTGDATDIYRKGAVLSGSVQLSGTATTKTYGILFSELESMAEFTEYAVTDGNKDFSVSLSNLTPGSVYYYCTYAHSGYSIAKGQVKSFTTPASNAPVFAEVSLLEKDEFSCKVSVTLIDEGGSKITLSGFCWNKQGEGSPTTDSHIHNVAISGNTMTTIIEGLEPNAVYQVRAYATNSDGVGYSDVTTIQTDEATAPVLSAIAQKESTDFSVILEANVTDSGTSPISKAGFCWSITNNTPTIDDTVNDLTAQLKDGKTTLNTALTDLASNTTYYIRAYATNEQGTSYSEVFTFKTAEAKAPTLSAITQKEATDFSVTFEAEITDGGNSAVTKAGFCWSTENKEPTVKDTTKELADQLTAENKKLSHALTELQPNTTYYIRAYATNNGGTTYSEVFTFKTAEAKAPTLSAITQKEATDFSVTFEAEITDGGNSAVTKAGFCWSTENKEPTVKDTTKELADQLTAENKKLSHALTELQPNTTYYIRAYATNNGGTTYSEVFTFKTPYKDAGNGDTGINNLPTEEWK